MKARTIRSFRDLKTGKIREKGEVFEVSKQRFEQIAAKLPGFIEAVPEPEPKNKQAKPAEKSAGTEE